MGWMIKDSEFDGAAENPVPKSLYKAKKKFESVLSASQHGVVAIGSRSRPVPAKNPPIAWQLVPYEAILDTPEPLLLGRVKPFRKLPLPS